MFRNERQILACTLMLVFALYYANICFFYHSHRIHGTTIIHSHVHDRAHAETGTHGETEITLIAALSVFQSLQPGMCPAAPEAFPVLLEALPSLPAENPARCRTTAIPPRAPPCITTR
jgi:hypothetical protein